MSKQARGLDKLGIKNIGNVIYNPDYETLSEDEKKKGECRFSDNGTAMVDTGIFTGRSPKDKYFVDQEPSNANIAWGSINQPVTSEIYKELLDLTLEQLSGKELYIVDAFAGASPDSRKAIRFVTEIAWQATLSRICSSCRAMKSSKTSNQISPSTMPVKLPTRDSRSTDSIPRYMSYST